MTIKIIFEDENCTYFGSGEDKCKELPLDIEKL